MNSKLAIALAFGGLAISAQAAAQVTFYESESFQGRSFRSTQQVKNLQRYGFNDRASSVTVAGARWEVCEGHQFRGQCMVLRPGRYPTLASLGLNDRISSARAVAANARVSDSRYAPLPAVAQVTFFENERFGGRSFIAKGEVANFNHYGFNDRASSVEVVGDGWEACDAAGFRGRCYVLRPGRYPSLASMGLNDRVSSVRLLDAGVRIDEGRYAPAHGGEAHGDYRRRNQERVYQADVTSVRAVVGAAEQRCWIEKEQVQAPATGMNTTGAIAGAIIGGILGHEVVDGKNRNLATVGGAAAGGFAGANIDRITGRPATEMRDVQKCASAPSTTPTYWDVSYNFRGQEHRVQMTSQPGATVTVNEHGEPRT